MKHWNLRLQTTGPQPRIGLAVGRFLVPVGRRGHEQVLGIVQGEPQGPPVPGRRTVGGPGAAASPRR
ncbi:hypothetical protein [Streptomyces canus]|uniref:hypothetical protein n=1 Tax=Streptomyces canus TaxID=58343 RepID=UPI0037156CC7